MEVADALQEHWLEEPPVEVLTALKMGYKPPSKKKGNVNDLLAMFPGGKIGLG